MNNNYNPFNIEEQQEVLSHKKLESRLQRETEESDMKWLMSSKRGRRIIFRILETARVALPIFSTNAMQMAWNEGNRNLGLYILTVINKSCPELYSVMNKESKDERTDHRTNQ